MSEDRIAFGWKENGTAHYTYLKRGLLHLAMDEIRREAPEDNMIATFFCETIIPVATSIFIDKDRNKELEEPFVQYFINGFSNSLKVIRHHKMVWALLDQYCK